MTEIPTPRFKVGDTIWYADIERVRKQHPCPDCLGSKVWRAVTPAGSEIEFPCLRCSPGFNRNDEIPSLEYSEFVARPVPMTIASIEVRTGTFAHDDWRSNITYFNQDGCCGTTIAEHRAFASEEDAMISARLKAAEANEPVISAAKLKAARMSSFTYRDAGMEKARRDVWNAWYAPRCLLDQITSLIDDKVLTPREKVEGFEEAYRDYRGNDRDAPSEQIDKIMRAAREVLPAEMFDGLPDFILPSLEASPCLTL